MIIPPAVPPGHAAAPGAVYGVKFPSRVAVSTDVGNFLVDMTGDGWEVVREGSALFLTIRAPIVAMNNAARAAMAAKGVIDP